MWKFIKTTLKSMAMIPIVVIARMFIGKEAFDEIVKKTILKVAQEINEKDKEQQTKA